MSELRKKMKETAKSRTVQECTLFGEKVLCKVYSMDGIKAVGDKLGAGNLESDIAKCLAAQFIDPDDKKPIFTAKFITEEMSQPDAMEMLSLFSRMNGSTGTVEDSEKN